MTNKYLSMISMPKNGSKFVVVHIFNFNLILVLLDIWKSISKQFGKQQQPIIFVCVNKLLIYVYLVNLNCDSCDVFNREIGIYMFFLLITRCIQTKQQLINREKNLYFSFFFRYLIDDIPVLICFYFEK